MTLKAVAWKKALTSFDPLDLPIQRNARKLKLDEDQEELCGANSCQAPQGHNSQAPNAEL
jgi:hypothetical protein